MSIININNIPDEILLMICLPLFDYLDFESDSNSVMLKQKDAVLVCSKWRKIFDEYDYISDGNQNICEDYSIYVINKFKNQLNFRTTFFYFSAWQSKQFVEMFADYVDWTDITKELLEDFNHFGFDFIDKFADKIQWDVFLEHSYLLALDVREIINKKYSRFAEFRIDYLTCKNCLQKLKFSDV